MSRQRRARLAGVARYRQNRDMKRAAGIQEALFGLAPTRPTRRRPPPRQTTVTIGAEAIAAAMAGRIDGEHAIAEAVRIALPDVRNVAVDLGTIRWTDPQSGRRVTFATPIVVRDALLGLAGGAVPEPFRFVLGRPARVTRGD
jgi:hypothetical protein